ncbi:MAG: ATP-binding cassette domain-containing protein, partial [Rhodospirillales bacterium]|nr:ATP-binding cassette domain-containing protein [Rhodospirillales bacterium]
MNESSPEAAPLILLKDVHLKLASPAGEVNILRGISLNVPPGETLGVIGPSGSGKTTMLMIMAGLEKPSSGQVCIAGHDLERLSEDKLALFRRDNVGIVFQAFHLVPTMTALENVAVPLELAGRRDAFQRAKELLQMVGLGARLGH